jgi:hypothetical protein
MANKVAYSNNPDAVSTEEEEADIAKGLVLIDIAAESGRTLKCLLAIALSLSEQKSYTPAPVVKEEPKKM